MDWDAETSSLFSRFVCFGLRHFFAHLLLVCRSQQTRLVENNSMAKLMLLPTDDFFDDSFLQHIDSMGMVLLFDRVDDHPWTCVERKKDYAD